jgi:hypothetical protein
MFVRGAVGIVLMLGIGLGVLAQIPSYLWGQLAVPEGAVAELARRAKELGVPMAVWEEEGLRFVGAPDEEGLRQAGVHLYLDGPMYLVGLETPSERAVLRGRGSIAELVLGPERGEISLPTEAFFDLLQALGLLGEGCTVALELRTVPLKLPRVPEDVKLDPTLWALVGHPDWFGAAQGYALERVGLRVRVVVELLATLPLQWEPFIRSSTDSLAELLLPIPLLPELGKDPAVRLVRPPFVPHPLGG